MAGIGQPYTSGNWVVKEGQQSEFVERWTAFVRWAADNVQGAESFVLIQDTRDPQRYVSMGTWDAIDTVNDWRSRPEFAEHLGRCRELCDDFNAGDFALAAAVP